MQVLLLGVSPPGMTALTHLGVHYDLVSLPSETHRLDDLDTTALGRLYVADYRDPARLALLPAPLDSYARVVSFTEYGLLPAAVLNAALGRTGADLGPVYRTRNKNAMRRVLSTAGLSTIRYGFGPPPPALDTVISKPVGGCGSIGVHRLQRHDFPTVAPDGYWEQYIPGPEFSVEAVSARGRHDILGVTRKVTSGAPGYIEVGHLFPADVAHSQRVALTRCTAEVLTVLGVRDGATHTELKLPTGTGRPQIIEVNTRPGGDGIPRLVQLTTGVDQYEAALRAQLSMGASPSPAAARTPRAQGAAAIFGLGACTVDQLLAALPDASRLSVVQRRTLPGDGEGSDARNSTAILTAQRVGDLVGLLDLAARMFDTDQV
jgi:hypothetical protein